MDNIGVEPKDYFLATLHRAENVDNEEVLGKILCGLNMISEHYKKKIVLPLMPRTRKQVRKFRIRIPKSILTIEPQGFLEFLKLEMDAIALLSDSGQRKKRVVF